VAYQINILNSFRENMLVIFSSSKSTYSTLKTSKIMLRFMVLLIAVTLPNSPFCFVDYKKSVVTGIKWCDYFPLLWINAISYPMDIYSSCTDFYREFILKICVFFKHKGVTQNKILYFVYFCVLFWVYIMTYMIQEVYWIIASSLYNVPSWIETLFIGW
jgi:hypothetical protein